MTLLLPSQLTDEFLLEAKMRFSEAAFQNLFENKSGRTDAREILGYVKTTYAEAGEVFEFEGNNYLAMVVVKTYGVPCTILIVGGGGAFDGYSPSDIVFAIQTGRLEDIE